MSYLLAIPEDRFSCDVAHVQQNCVLTHRPNTARWHGSNRSGERMVTGLSWAIPKSSKCCSPTYEVEPGPVYISQDNVTGCGIMSSVLNMILHLGSTIKVSPYRNQPHIHVRMYAHTPGHLKTSILVTKKKSMLKLEDQA